MNKNQKDQKNMNASSSAASYRPNTGGQNYQQPKSGGNQGTGTQQRPGFSQLSDQTQKCAEPSQTKPFDPKREQKNQPAECDRNTPKHSEKAPEQISKEEKNRAEAPSQEDWEGGASRPENEGKQGTWDAARQQNKQENRERSKAVGNEAEIDDEDTSESRKSR